MFYEVTLTLRPRLYKYLPQDQHDKCLIFLHALCKKYQMSLICELTGELNVHYHGLVDFKDLRIRGNFLNEFRKLNNFFGKKSVNQVVYEESYRKYMIKDVSKTQQFVIDPIVYDCHGFTNDSIIIK